MHVPDAVTKVPVSTTSLTMLFAMSYTQSSHTTMEGSFKHGLVATSPARSFEPHTTHEDGSKGPSADRSAFFSFVCAWTNSDINVSIPHCLNVAVVSCKRLIALVFAARSIFVLASWNQKGFFGFLKNKKPIRKREKNPTQKCARGRLRAFMFGGGVGKKRKKRNHVQ